MKNKKGFLDMSFAWLFALIVGAIILVIAIYFSTKLIQTDQTVQDAKTGKDIAVLLNPLESGFESGQVVSLEMPVKTRIYNRCRTDGTFGSQIIEVSQEGIGGKWSKTNIDVSFESKYLFSEGIAEGKKFYLFSKSFEFPFKVTDLIYIIPESKIYCFIDAPESIQDELSNLKQKNLLYEDCSNRSDVIKVCFSSLEDCEVNVIEGSSYIEKKGERMDYSGDALMYAGIFSDKDVYECQLKRVMQRLSQLALLYNNKAVFISSTAGCDTNLDLLGLSNMANNKEFSSADLFSMTDEVERIGQENRDNGECRLW